VIAAPLALAAALAALPEGTVRWRAEVRGEPVGWADLRVGCGARGCLVRYRSRLRLPAESGGGVLASDVEVEVDRDGAYRGGRVVVDGAPRGAGAELAGAVPASLLEVVLAGAADGACARWFDERAPAPRRSCARREGARVLADADGVAEEIVPGADGLPAEVRVEGSLAFVRDPGAQLPARAPRLAGTRVPGPEDPGRARSFCGASLDPDPGAAPAGLPPPRASGESCREKAAAWVREARRRGREAREAVGVAFDGGGFVWHAWAEVRDGSRWIPVDPSFGELPARGPRFTLATQAGEPGDRARAGARVLRCWGAAGVLP
jgi:hypothetical protein